MEAEPALSSITIGILRERSLHAALKAAYCREGDGIEVRVGAYHIDLVRPRGDGEPPLLIEIQTRSFANMKRKLAALLDDYPIRVVHPIAIEKWIIRENADGTQVSRRKSPRRAGVEALFRELVAFPHLVMHPNFALDVLLTHEEEIWRDDGQGSWRRKHWSIRDHRLLAVADQLPLETPRDFALLLPDSLPAAFTSTDMATQLKIARPLAGKMAFCLREMGAIVQVGKQGKAYVYTRTEGA